MHPFRSHSLYVLTAALAAAQVQPPPDHRHDHDEPLALENFVISASPYARSQADLAQPTGVLAGRELNLRMAPTLGELLAGQPGVSSSYFGPGASRPVIRGLTGDRIRVLENSLGTTDASVISPDHAVSLDPLLIERVEVVRGPAALLYGGNAVGGVVNVITHRIHTSLPDTPVQGRLEVRGNSADREESAGLVLEGAAGPIAWHADYYHRRASDVKIPGFAESARRRAMEDDHHHHDHDDDHDDHDDHHDEEEPVFGRIPNTALRNEGGAFGLSFIGRRGYFGFSHSVHDSRYGIPAGVHAHLHGHDDHDDHDHEDDHHHEEDHDEDVTIDLRQRRWEFQGEITEPFGAFRGARFKLGTARYRHTEFEGDEIGTVFRNRGYDGRVELLHQPVGVFTGAIGWQGGRSDFEAFGDEAFVPPSRTTTNALFVFEEAELAPFTWQVGARVEAQDLALRDGSGTQRDDTALSASTGLVWKLDDTWTLAASLARTQRAPNVQELYADGPHAATAAYEIGDPTLRRERSLALDVTLRKRAGFVTGAVTVFANRFNGFIFEVPTGETAVPHHDHWHFHGGHDHDDHHDDHDHHHDAEGGLPVYRFVQRDARFHGAELEAVFHLHGDGANQLDLIVGADFVRGRNRGDGEHLPRITPARTKAGLVWSHGPWVLGGEVQWVSGQRRTAPNELPTDGYELVSAYATYRHVAGRTVWDFFVRGTNLGDAEARVHTSLLKDVAPLAGRSVNAGVRLSF